MRPSKAASRRRSESQRVELIRCRRSLVFDFSELAFFDHVHDLDASDKNTGAAKGLEPQHRSGDAFNGPVVCDGLIKTDSPIGC